ncbi:hypothetical protein V5097_09810 [Arenibacter palladensis]|uniref:hypothetical protein n=1 Tax=Arenibacter palladensis TaxID=237373 RepID=UPI002FD48768
MIEGNKTTFRPQVRRQKYNSACSSGNNFDKDQDKSRFSMTYVLTTSSNNYGQVFDLLTLVSHNGSQLVFSN